MAKFRRWHFRMHFREWKLLYFYSNFTESPTDDKPAPVHIKAWRQAGTKPLSEPVKTYFTNLCPPMSLMRVLTHWGRVTHICVGNLAIIGSDNGLSPGRRRAIIRTNAGVLLIGP